MKYELFPETNSILFEVYHELFLPFFPIRFHFYEIFSIQNRTKREFSKIAERKKNKSENVPKELNVTCTFYQFSAQPCRRENALNSVS